MPSSVSLTGAMMALAVWGSGLPQADSLPPLSNQIQTPPAEALAQSDGEIARGSSRDAATRYDEVGLASWYGEELGASARAANGEHFDPAAITIAHRTLPLGSFVEITAIDTGRTIAARVTDRGPHRRDRLIDMSRGAAKLLGTYGKSVAAVRVRSVSLSPGDEAALTAGQAASARLDEPPQLLAALRKRLGGEPNPVAAAKTTMPPIEVVALKTTGDTNSEPLTAKQAKHQTAVAAPPARGDYLVQLGTFSDRDHARSLAARLSGRVEPAGKLWRVRLGPFATSAEAKRARDGAAKRGYGDAVVVHED